MFMEWSTESAPPAQRFDQWREACREHVYALTPQRDTRTPFQGTIARRQLGPLDVTDIQCEGHLVQRLNQDIGERPSDTYYIYLQRRGRAWFEQQGRRCVVEPGDILIADPNIAFSTGTNGTFDFRLWRIDRASLQGSLGTHTGDLPMRRIGREQAARQLITNWLDALLRQHAALSPQSLELACATLCALVAHACEAAAGPREPARQARRRALLQRVMHEMELRSSDMSLTPERVANTFGISLRALHQLFELSPHSFHEFLTLIRLAHARALLTDPSSRHVGTAEIGFAAGFRETSTFYRRFKQQYGAPPGTLRKGMADSALQEKPAFR